MRISAFSQSIEGKWRRNQGRTRSRRKHIPLNCKLDGTKKHFTIYRRYKEQFRQQVQTVCVLKPRTSSKMGIIHKIGALVVQKLKFWALRRQHNTSKDNFLCGWTTLHIFRHSTCMGSSEGADKADWRDLWKLGAKQVTTIMFQFSEPFSKGNCGIQCNQVIQGRW